VKLQDHPEMRYRKSPNWPPTWTWVGGGENTHPKGEIGILTAVIPSRIDPRCFLSIDYADAAYLGALLFNDEPFCHAVRNLLLKQIGQPITQIGDLDVGHLLWATR
jgi:hypothetical protein